MELILLGNESESEHVELTEGAKFNQLTSFDLTPDNNKQVSRLL